MKVLQTFALPLGYGTNIGAGDEARTRYLHLGKVALYQMSYTRVRVRRSLLHSASGKRRKLYIRRLLLPPQTTIASLDCGLIGVRVRRTAPPQHKYGIGASGRNRTNDTGIFSPLLYRLSYRGKWRPGTDSNCRPPA